MNNSSNGAVYALTWVEVYRPESGAEEVTEVHALKFSGNGGTIHIGAGAGPTYAPLIGNAGDFLTDIPPSNGCANVAVLKVDIEVDASDTDSCHLNSDDRMDNIATVKGPGDVILKAVLQPDTPEIRNQLTWDGAAQQADKITAKVSRTAAAKHSVTAKIGGNACREANVWVVWTEIDDLNTTGPTPADSDVSPSTIPNVPPFEYGASGSYGNQPGTDNRFQNGILLRTTISPAGFSNQNGSVQFRFIRTLEKCGWAKWQDTGWAQRPPGYIQPGEPDGPSAETQDVIPSVQDHIYNVDGPGIGGPVDLWDEAVYRGNFDQHVEVYLPCRLS